MSLKLRHSLKSFLLLNIGLHHFFTIDTGGQIGGGVFLRVIGFAKVVPTLKKR